MAVGPDKRCPTDNLTAVPHSSIREPKLLDGLQGSIQVKKALYDDSVSRRDIYMEGRPNTAKRQTSSRYAFIEDDPVYLAGPNIRVRKYRVKTVTPTEMEGIVARAAGQAIVACPAANNIITSTPIYLIGYGTCACKSICAIAKVIAQFACVGTDNRVVARLHLDTVDP